MNRWFSVKFLHKSEPLVYQIEYRESIDGPVDASEPGVSDRHDDSRPLQARHYQSDAWRPFTVDNGYSEVQCTFNPNPERGSDATICMIPTYLDTVEKPEKMKERANVTSEWLDRLTDLGCSILFVHGKWFDNLSETAELVQKRYDPFVRVEKRIEASINHLIDNDCASPRKVVAIGSSRYGFGVLHAMARNDDIAGVIAHQPIVWWPKMAEFSDVPYHHDIIQRNSLFERVGEYPPRPILIQSGYMDQRVGPFAMESFIESAEEAYVRGGSADQFSHERMAIPGHSGRVPDSALDSVTEWMVQHGFDE